MAIPVDRSGLTTNTTLADGTTLVPGGGVGVQPVSGTGGVTVVQVSLVATTLPPGTVNVPYAQALAATGGTAPYTYQQEQAPGLTGFPPGIAMSETGVLSGTPTKSGKFQAWLQVTDYGGHSALAVVTIVIPVSPTIGNTSLPDGVVEESYFASLTATGGAAPYSFSITAGALPLGLTLATNGGITGLPTVAGVFYFTVQVSDANAPPATASVQYSITIAAEDAIEADAVRSLDQCVLLGAADGGLYMVVPGQRHDEDNQGNPRGFLQRWAGVPTSGGRMAINQLGGATVGAKGQGQLNVSAVDDQGNVVPLSSDKRPMNLMGSTEVTRDFMAKGVGHSARFGIVLDNGNVPDQYFEAHVAILWMRPFFTNRKA